jgi:asparagine synthetase A
VANEVGEGKGFDQNRNSVILMKRDGAGQVASDVWPNQSKEDIARQLVGEIIHVFGY